MLCACQGDQWTKNDNWGIRQFLGSWFGVTDSNLDGFVTDLSLSRNGLKGAYSV